MRVAIYASIALAGLILIAAVKHAKAHDWYPKECCSGMDCAPVDKVVIESSPFIAGLAGSLVPPAQAAPSIMIVTTRHGTVVVPQNFQHRASKDGRMHACIRSERLICFFMPPAM